LAVEQENIKAQVIEFMLKEYERLHQLSMDENKQTEQRVNFFLAIVSTIVAGLIILSQSTKITSEFFLNITLVALIILLLFGIKIMNRLNMRVIQIRAFKTLRKAIQEYFLNSNDERIRNFIKVQNNTFSKKGMKFGKVAHLIVKVMKFVSKGKCGEQTLLRSLKISATLNSVVVLINGLLVGGIVLVIVKRLGFELNTLSIGGAMILSFISMKILLYYNRFFINNQLPWE